MISTLLLASISLASYLLPFIGPTKECPSLMTKDLGSNLISLLAVAATGLSRFADLALWRPQTRVVLWIWRCGGHRLELSCGFGVVAATDPSCLVDLALWPPQARVVLRI